MTRSANTFRIEGRISRFDGVQHFEGALVESELPLRPIQRTLHAGQHPRQPADVHGGPAARTVATLVQHQSGAATRAGVTSGRTGTAPFKRPQLQRRTAAHFASVDVTLWTGTMTGTGAAARRAVHAASRSIVTSGSRSASRCAVHASRTLP